jgi:hypothetical protein
VTIKAFEMPAVADARDCMFTWALLIVRIRQVGASADIAFQRVFAQRASSRGSDVAKRMAVRALDQSGFVHPSLDYHFLAEKRCSAIQQGTGDVAVRI